MGPTKVVYGAEMTGGLIANPIAPQTKRSRHPKAGGVVGVNTPDAAHHAVYPQLVRALGVAVDLWPTCFHTQLVETCTSGNYNTKTGSWSAVMFAVGTESGLLASCHPTVG